MKTVKRKRGVHEPKGKQVSNDELYSVFRFLFFSFVS
jgi:hypothetical protein